MKDTKILSEDKIKLTQDQKNLIELAFIKQLPPEDARFIKNVQKEAKQGGNSFAKLSEYYTSKYGLEFGMIYLSAIMGGEKKYKETKESIENAKAENRSSKN